MRCRDGSQGYRLESLGLDLRDEISTIQTAHAVSDEVDFPAGIFFRDQLLKSGRTVCYRRGSSDSGNEYLDTVRFQDFPDASPVGYLQATVSFAKFRDLRRKT